MPAVENTCFILFSVTVKESVAMERKREREREWNEVEAKAFPEPIGFHGVDKPSRGLPTMGDTSSDSSERANEHRYKCYNSFADLQK